MSEELTPLISRCLWCLSDRLVVCFIPAVWMEMEYKLQGSDHRPWVIRNKNRQNWKVTFFVFFSICFTPAHSYTALELFYYNCTLKSTRTLQHRTGPWIPHVNAIILCEGTCGTQGELKMLKLVNVLVVPRSL